MSTVQPVKKKMPVGRMILLGVIALFVLIFVFSNLATASFQFLGWTISLPAWLMFAIVFVLGMLLGGSVRSIVRRARGKSKPHSD